MTGPDQAPFRANRWLLVNLAMSGLFCALPTGVPGVVLALAASNAWRRGDTVAARRKLRAAAILGALSLLWGALAVIAVVAAVVTAVVRGDHLAPPSY
jgi:hypothetical protein